MLEGKYSNEEEWDSPCLVLHLLRGLSGRVFADFTLPDDGARWTSFGFSDCWVVTLSVELEGLLSGLEVAVLTPVDCRILAIFFFRRR